MSQIYELLQGWLGHSVQHFVLYLLPIQTVSGSVSPIRSRPEKVKCVEKLSNIYLTLPYIDYGKVMHIKQLKCKRYRMFIYNKKRFNPLLGVILKYILILLVVALDK